MTETSFMPQHPWGNLSLFLLSLIELMDTLKKIQSGLLYKLVYWVERWLKSKHLEMCFNSKRDSSDYIMVQVVDSILCFQYSLAAPGDSYCCSSVFQDALNVRKRERSDEHRDLSIWAILTPLNIFITRLIMPVVLILRVRFCVTSKAKLVRTAAYKEPFHCSFLSSLTSQLWLLPCG